MNPIELKMRRGVRWGVLGEAAAKAAAPISTMLLARLLTPEAFGVMVSATLVLSLAEIVTDAGFQKYIVQTRFGRGGLSLTADVAFWTNMGLSAVLWCLLVLLASPLAAATGNPGHGAVVGAIGLCLPLGAAGSIHGALMKRRMAFRSLMKVRIVASLVPLAVTVPLAVLTRSYQALVWGMCAQYAAVSLMQMRLSGWQPRLRWSLAELKRMLPFTIAVTAESAAVWLTGYVDIFLIAGWVRESQLGLYRTAITTVGQVMTLVTASTVPVLFAGLSQLQSGDWRGAFLSFQRKAAWAVLPLGALLWLGRDLFTSILLGDQWGGAALMVGLWGLTGAFAVVYSFYASEVYRSQGRPMVSVCVQGVQIVAIAAAVGWSVRVGFDTLCVARSLVRLVPVAVNLAVLSMCFGVPARSQLKGTGAAAVLSLGLAAIGWWLTLL